LQEKQVSIRNKMLDLTSQTLLINVTDLSATATQKTITHTQPHWAPQASKNSAKVSAFNVQEKPNVSYGKIN